MKKTIGEDVSSDSTTTLARTATKRPRPRRTSSSVTIETYRDDPLYPKIVRTVKSILDGGKVVAPVEVLVQMSLLDREQLEDWRKGRIPYLERVIKCNLTRLSRLLRILRFHAHDLNLKPSWTVYMRWGKGPKQRLRFTRTGEEKLEEIYATHLVWPGKGPFHPPVSKQAS